MAQTAIHDANFVTANIKKQLRGKPPRQYEPARPVYAIPVGPHWSAVRWGKLEIYGYPGWILRRLADLRLYLKFLPPAKALTVWRYGIVAEESCDVCKSL
jgi:NADH dehydrogenase FAD-containing subunit